LVLFASLSAAGRAQLAYVGHAVGGFPYSPYGGAMDSAGNFYFADQLSQTILKVPAGCLNSGCVITLGDTSSFSYPSGVAVDSSGNVYVADTGDSLVKEIPAGCVADGSCVVALGDGTLYPALYGIAVDSSGNVYFSDVNQGVVYEMTPGCTQSSCIQTLGGGFIQPMGLAVDASGNVFVSDAGSPAAVYEMPPNCTEQACVLTLGGGFTIPQAVALDSYGNVYVADEGAGQIYEFPGGCNNSGCVTTVGGGFAHPTGVALDASGNVFFSDYGASMVGEVVRSAVDMGAVPVNSSTPATLTVTFTFTTNGVAVGSTAVVTQGATGLDFTDALSGNCAAATYNTDDTCTVNVKFTAAHPGPRYGAVVLYDTASPANVLATAYIQGTGTGPQATFADSTAGPYLPSTQSNVGLGFSSPFDVAVDAAGDVWVSDFGNNAVKGYIAAGGSYSVAGFSQPQSVAIDSSGNIIVADAGNNAVKEITAASGYTTVTTVGSGFLQPQGVAVDGSGNIFVADSGNSAVKEIVAAGGYTTIATVGSGFSAPSDVAVDGNGNIFVADSGNVNEIVAVGGLVSSASTVNVVASGFAGRVGVAVDASGNLFVADSNLNQVDKYSAASGYTTFSVLGSGFNNPLGVAVAGSGNVYVADRGNNRVEKLDFADPPSVSFATTNVGETSSTETITVSNDGNAALTFRIPDSGTNPSVSNGFALDGATTCPELIISSAAGVLSQGTSCTYAINFAPTIAGTYSGSAILTDDSLNVTTFPQDTQTVALTGTAVQAPASITINGSSSQSAEVGSSFVSSTTYGPLAVTVLDGVGAPIPNLAGVTFTAGTGSNGGSGSFAGPTNTVTVSTDINGVADPLAFTANDIADSYTVTVTAGSVQATFNMTNTAGGFDHFGFTAPAQAFIGWPFALIVTPEDQYNNAVPTFSDTVQVTSTDPLATLPPDSTLCGCGRVFVTLNSPGSWTITVTDGTVSSTTSAIPTSAPASIVVNTNGDDAGLADNCAPAAPAGVCSLRDALAYAASLSAGTITFDSTVFNAGNLAAQNIITLTNGVLEIPNDTSITGPYNGAGDTLVDLITVSGNGAGGVFQITDPNHQGAIKGIAITGGMLNDPTPGALVSGAAIYNNGTLWVDSSLISGNFASTPDSTGEVDGGAIYSDNDLEISNSTITGNAANSGGGAFGGGIFNLSYVNANNLIVSNNSASATGPGGVAGGGGIFTWDMDMDHSTVSGNSAPAASDGSGLSTGGGIFAFGEEWVNSSTIAGNSATGLGSGGAGGYYGANYQELYNVTISGNTADALGGGLLLDSAALMVLGNTIVSGNTAPDRADFAKLGDLINIRGNVIHKGGLNLAPLADYGGGIPTMLPLPGSLAICNGLAANIPIGEGLDERGYSNLNTTYDGFSPASPCADSGAVQTNYAMTFSTAPTPNSPYSSIYTVTTFNTAVTLSEIGTTGPSGISIPLSLNGSGTLTGGNATTSAGIATYPALKVNAAGSSDTLTATLSLNGALSTPVALTQTSSSFVVLPGPSAVSVTPSSGFGTTQQFSFVASSPDGASHVSSVYMLFNTSVSRVNGCELAYAAAGNQLRLVSDAGTSSTLGHPGTAGTLSNSQCSVDVGNTTVASSGNDLTISPVITFKSGFTAGVLIYLNVGDISGLSTGFTKMGWWVAGSSPEQAPSAVSVTPSSGYGTSQKFDFVASSPNGAANIAFVNMLFNTSLSRVNGCYLGYLAAGNQLSLVSDDGATSSLGQPGTAGTLSNSQCSVDLGATTVIPSGNTLTVSPAITFNSGFTAGVQIYMNVGDFPGLSTGFKKMGWWIVGSSPEQAPSAVSVTPSSGYGLVQRFDFVASSPNGAANIAFVNMLFNTSLSRVNGCYLAYAAAGNQLRLISDDGTTSTSGHPGGTGTLSNSQCSVDLDDTTVTASGDTLTVSPAICFNSGFTAGVQIYMAVGDVPGMSTAFQKVGWWMVGSSPEQAPSAVSVTPSSGFGTTQQFDFVASSPNGAANITFVYMLFNTSLSRVNGCFVGYVVAGNQLSLVSDDGTTSSVGHPGTAGTLSNSQCSVDVGATTVVPSGNTLTVSPVITFKSGFTAGVQIYMNVGDLPGMNTGLTKMGWWMVGSSPEQAPSAVSVTPSSGYGTTQQFDFVGSSPNGAANIAFVYMLFSTAVNPANACLLRYTPAGNQLSLVSDDGTTSTSGHPGGTGTLSNSQCSVDLASTTVAATGNTLTVSPNITFNPGFMTGLHIYMNVGDIPGMRTGYRQMSP